MKKETYTSKGITWERVPRNKAKKAYDEGHWITLYPVNLKPRTVCNPPCPIRNDCGMTGGMTFESVVDEFERYNCNREWGRYAKFFITNGIVSDKEVYEAYNDMILENDFF